MAQQEKHAASSSNFDSLRRCYILFVMIALFVVIFLVISLVMIIMDPREANFVVENASLTQIDLGSKNTTSLPYNLDLSIAVTNPSKYSDIYYDSVEVRTYYNESLTLSPFYVPHKSTHVLNPVFPWQNALTIIGVKLCVKFRYGLFGSIKSWQSTSSMHFCFMVPLDPHDSKSQGNSAATLETTNCVAPFSDS